MSGVRRYTKQEELANERINKRRLAAALKKGLSQYIDADGNVVNIETRETIRAEEAKRKLKEQSLKKEKELANIKARREEIELRKREIIAEQKGKGKDYEKHKKLLAELAELAGGAKVLSKADYARAVAFGRSNANLRGAIFGGPPPLAPNLGNIAGDINRRINTNPIQNIPKRFQRIPEIVANHKLKFLGALGGVLTPYISGLSYSEIYGALASGLYKIASKEFKSFTTDILLNAGNSTYYYLADSLSHLLNEEMNEEIPQEVDIYERDLYDLYNIPNVNTIALTNTKYINLKAANQIANLDYLISGKIGTTSTKQPSKIGMKLQENIPQNKSDFKQITSHIPGNKTNFNIGLNNNLGNGTQENIQPINEYEELIELEKKIKLPYTEELNPKENNLKDYLENYYFQNLLANLKSGQLRRDMLFDFSGYENFSRIRVHNKLSYPTGYAAMIPPEGFPTQYKQQNTDVRYFWFKK